MKALGLFLILFATPASVMAQDYLSQTESPHAQAIRLVTQVRADEIKGVDDNPDWWHDTKERVWSVKRPFAPGMIDSTHYFVVSYTIDGRVVGTWSVNTRTGQVAGPGEPLKIE